MSGIARTLGKNPVGMSLALVRARLEKASDVPFGWPKRVESGSAARKASVYRTNVGTAGMRTVAQAGCAGAAVHSKLVQCVKSDLQNGRCYKPPGRGRSGGTFIKVGSC